MLFYCGEGSFWWSESFSLEVIVDQENPPAPKVPERFKSGSIDSFILKQNGSVSHWKGQDAEKIIQEPLRAEASGFQLQLKFAKRWLQCEINKSTGFSLSVKSPCSSVLGSLQRPVLERSPAASANHDLGAEKAAGVASCISTHITALLSPQRHSFKSHSISAWDFECHDLISCNGCMNLHKHALNQALKATCRLSNPSNSSIWCLCMPLYLAKSCC